MSLLREIHRRSLWQILGVYVVAAWVALQVVDVLADNFGLPGWFPAFAMALMILGLPIILATAFVQKGGPTAGALRGPGARPFADPALPPPVNAGAEGQPPSASRASAESARAHEQTGAQHHLFSWRNAIAGGVLAFALLGVIAAGWMVSRALGIGPAASLVAQGVLDERDPIILAEFAGDSGDEELASAATEAFRVDLVQSPVVTLVEPRSLAEVLGRMERPGESRIDRDLALEIALREGIKAVIAGEINAAGGQYVISASLLAAETGEELAAFRETASDSSRIISAIDDLSESLRGRIGESLRSVRSEESLERVTTGSLEALRKYSQGVYALEVEGNDARGITLLEEAVELDPEFAMAWRKLGAAFGNINERSREVAARTRAFEYRDRLTDKERYLTMASYYANVTGEYDRAITAYENLLEINPNDAWAFNNLALVYGQLRDFARAEELYLLSATYDSANSIPYTNAVSAQVAQEKYDQAAATLEASASLFPEDPWTVYYQGVLASSQGDYATASERMTTVASDRPTDLFWRDQTEGVLGAIASTRGQFREAERNALDEMTAAEQRGALRQYLESATAFVQVLADSREDPAAGRRFLEAALEAHPIEELPQLDRPYIDLAFALVVLGDLGPAAELIAEYESEIEPALRRADEPDLHRIKGRLAFAQGRHDDAIQAFRRSDTGACRLCPMIFLAEVYEAMGAADSAIALRERWLETPAVFRVMGDRFVRGPTLERLGQLYDERGDQESAASYYAAFIELWADADAEVQPRVAAAQERLQEILEARG